MEMEELITQAMQVLVWRMYMFSYPPHALSSMHQHDVPSLITFQITEHLDRRLLTQSTASRFSLAILAAGSIIPLHYPLVEWLTNVSRRDNPVTDYLCYAQV